MTPDRREQRPIEERVVTVDGWIKKINEYAVVEPIDPELVRSVLEFYGANFSEEEEVKTSLREYTNKAKRSGLDAVWGKERIDRYKAWCEAWADQFEKVEGNKPLPKLKESGSKISGMLQFFGELAGFAAGQLSWHDFRERTVARALNGQFWQAGEGLHRIRIKIPTSKEPILLASFPPGFPRACWEKIKSWKIT